MLSCLLYRASAQGVDESTPFAPHVRGEIGAFGWHVVSHLPATWEEGRQHFVNEQGGRHKFFNVWPYMKPLRSWIAKRRRAAGGRRGGGGGDGPGKSFRNFAFDQQEILRHVSFAAAE